jgi:polyisoprenoid-binding protein YceI
LIATREHERRFAVTPLRISSPPPGTLAAMRSRNVLVAAVAVLLLAIGGGAFAYVSFLQGDNVAPLTLPGPGDPSAAAGNTGTTSASGAPAASLGPATTTSIDAGSIPGTWSVAADSIAGYRVRERLASLTADSDAVGRTSGVTGTVTIAGSGGKLSVTAADLSVDMASLASDRPMRDNRLRNDGIETRQFPTSTFKLTQSVTLPDGAATGSVVNLTLHGDLTLHGMTKAIDIPIQARLDGSVIQVVGSYQFPFSDFAINAPNIAGFVAVEDHGTLEFQVNLAKG